MNRKLVFLCFSIIQLITSHLETSFDCEKVDQDEVFYFNLKRYYISSYNNANITIHVLYCTVHANMTHITHTVHWG
jgi:hypothetical protein